MTDEPHDRGRLDSTMDPSAPKETGMRYVMVPVPREHVLDVMRWVLFRAPDDIDSADQLKMQVAIVVKETDDFGRAVLRLVAGAAQKNEPLSLSDAAGELQADSQATSTAIRDLNQLAFAGRRLLIDVRAETTVGPRGKRGKTSFLVMSPEIAHLVKSALREDHAGSP
jgi:hypothetical protein